MALTLIKILLVFWTVGSTVGLPSFQGDIYHSETSQSVVSPTIRNSTNMELFHGINVQKLRNVAAWKASKKRSKRSLSLVSMVDCGAQCSRKYLIWHGSFCGPGGSGRPINRIDMCCEQHDNCYNMTYYFHDCGWWSSYFGRYNWNCANGRPHCWDYQSNNCKVQLCQCDRDFVDCLNEAAKFYYDCY